MCLVVGEYVGDYGFPLPNPVSIHREYPRSRFWIEWCMQTLQKNEATWYRMLIGDNWGELKKLQN